MKTKIEIKSIYGNVLFEFEKENNTIKDTVIEAVKSRAYLSDANLSRADLCGANLSGANLCGADLSRADLCGANLSRAYLSGADLSGANLCGANLSDADLSGAYLCGTNLSRAYLSGANLSRADLCGANLSRADLSGANLSDVNFNESTAFYALSCPSHGEFTAWKKASGKLVKLLVTEGAKRSSATSYKCRVSEAKVVWIEDELTEVVSNHDPNFIYRLNEIVKVDYFNEDRWNECSTGIHCFSDIEQAKKWS